MWKQSFWPKTEEKDQTNCALYYGGSFALTLSIGTGEWSERRSLFLSRPHILQPVSIDARCRGLPRALHGLRNRFRKERELLFPRIIKSRLLELGKNCSRCRVEVFLRHSRIRFALPMQKPSNVSAIFFQQSLRAVLGMSLKMHEQALLFLFHECIHSALSRLREHAV